MDFLKKISEAYYRHTTKFFRRMVPFVGFVVGGSFFLRELGTIRYTFRKSNRLTEAEARQAGLKVDDDETLKEMLEEIQKKDLNNWENIRGPRPWEDSKSIQEAQRKALEQKKATEQKQEVDKSHAQEG